MTERSPWFYVVLGCGGFLLVLTIAIGVFGYVGFRAVKRTREEMADPVAREARALKILRSKRLPAGYHPVVNLSFPVVLDLVVLADRPPDEEGELSEDTERLFVYIKTLAWDKDWREYADGRADPTELLREQGFQLDSEEILARGEVRAGKQEIAYVAHRGGFHAGQHGRVKTDGLATLMFIRCPDDKKMRVVVWTGPDPGADATGLVDTQADTGRIRAFMSEFALCG